MFGRSELNIRLGDVISCFHYFLQQGPWFWKCLQGSEKASRKVRQKVSTDTKVRDHGNKNWSKSSKIRAVYLFFIKIIQQLQVIYTRFAAARNPEFGYHLRSINGQTHSKVASISKAYNFLVFFLLFFR